MSKSNMIHIIDCLTLTDEVCQGLAYVFSAETLHSTFIYEALTTKSMQLMLLSRPVVVLDNDIEVSTDDATAPLLAMYESVRISNNLPKLVANAVVDDAHCYWFVCATCGDRQSKITHRVDLKKTKNIRYVCGECAPSFDDATAMKEKTLRKLLWPNDAIDDSSANSTPRVDNGFVAMLAFFANPTDINVIQVEALSVPHEFRLHKYATVLMDELKNVLCCDKTIQLVCSNILAADVFSKYIIYYYTNTFLLII